MGFWKELRKKMFGKAVRRAIASQWLAARVYPEIARRFPEQAKAIITAIEQALDEI